MSPLAQWTAALDALEEWVRRMSSGLKAVDLPDEPPALPECPVPAGQQVRARALLERLQAAQSAALKRREQLAREAAYGAA